MKLSVKISYTLPYNLHLMQSVINPLFKNSTPLIWHLPSAFPHFVAYFNHLHYTILHLNHKWWLTPSKVTGTAKPYLHSLFITPSVLKFFSSKPQSILFVHQFSSPKTTAETIHHLPRTTSLLLHKVNTFCLFISRVPMTWQIENNNLPQSG